MRPKALMPKLPCICSAGCMFLDGVGLSWEWLAAVHPSTPGHLAFTCLLFLLKDACMPCRSLLPWLCAGPR